MIFKVKLSSGEVEWSTDAVKSPVGACLFRNQYVLATSSHQGNTVKVWILETNSGKLNISKWLN